MATKRGSNGNSANDIPSEESFTPSETSEKYADVLSPSPELLEKEQHGKSRRKKRSSKRNSSASSSSSAASHALSSGDEKRGKRVRQVSEAIQTDAELPRDEDKVISGDDDDDDDDSSQILFPKRHVLLFMIFLGFINIYAMRVNLNVAIVAMVNNKTVILRNGIVRKYVRMICHVSLYLPSICFLQ